MHANPLGAAGVAWVIGWEVGEVMLVDIGVGWSMLHVLEKITEEVKTKWI